VPIRYVQIGSISGAAITLPSAVLRSSAIELMGSGIGSIPLEPPRPCVGDLLRATPMAGFKIATQAVPLSNVAEAWLADDNACRTVLTMGAA